MSGYDFGLALEVTRIALAAEIDAERANIPEGSTDTDRERAWLSVAFWPVLAQVLRDHGVDNETGEDLRWMLIDLLSFTRSQGWDAGAKAMAEVYGRGMGS